MTRKTKRNVKLAQSLLIQAEFPHKSPAISLYVHLLASQPACLLHKTVAELKNALIRAQEPKAR